MGLFKSSKQKLQDKVDREVERWRPTRTSSGSNIETVLMIYTVAVFAVALLLVAIAPKAVMAQLLIFGAAVGALSVQVKRMVVPVVYRHLAPHFGWSDFEQAMKAEVDAREVEAALKAGKQAAAAEDHSSASTHQESEPPRLDDNARAVLQAYMAKPREERKGFTQSVVEVLKKRGHSFEDLESAESEEDRLVLGDLAIRRLAKANGLAGAA